MQISTGGKICHLTSGHPVEIRIFYKECVSLKNAGHEVALIALHDRDEIMNGIKIRALQTPKSLFQRVTKTVWTLYKFALEEDSAVYHFHDPELIICGLLLKLRDRAVIYDVHEDVPRSIYSKRWIPKVLRKVIAVSFEAVENFAAKKLDAIVAATPEIGRRFVKLGIPVAVVNNYPILSDLFVPDTEWKKKERTVCYVGGISKERGLHQILTAIAESDCHLTFAGWFSSDKERSEAENSVAWKKVNDLGKISREQVKILLSKSMAGLVLFHPEPNHINAQPNKMFEYMSAGIPVIASDFLLWRQIIEGAGCGLLVDPMNPKAIAAAIRWILDHPTEAEAMGKRGRLAVERTYNWDAEAVKMIQLYETLLSKKGAAEQAQDA